MRLAPSHPSRFSAPTVRPSDSRRRPSLHRTNVVSSPSRRSRLTTSNRGCRAAPRSERPSRVDDHHRVTLVSTPTRRRAWAASGRSRTGPARAPAGPRRNLCGTERAVRGVAAPDDDVAVRVDPDPRVRLGAVLEGGDVEVRDRLVGHRGRRDAEERQRQVAADVRDRGASSSPSARAPGWQLTLPEEPERRRDGAGGGDDVRVRQRPVLRDALYQQLHVRGRGVEVRRRHRAVRLAGLADERRRIAAVDEADRPCCL